MLEYTVLAKTHHNLEELLAKEIELFGGTEVQPINRGVKCKADKETLYRLNLQSRLANRYLVQIAKFKIENEDDLYKQVRKIEWYTLFNVDKTFSIDATVMSSIFNHTNYPALVAKDAIVDCFRIRVKERPNVDTKSPDVRIDLFISDKDCVISLDSSGDGLHMRGYRTESNEAPINEVLAAGILDYTGWTPDIPFYDPMCGSGTFLVEAGIKAQKGIVNPKRYDFCFRNWIDFNKDILEKVKSVEGEYQTLRMYGSDIQAKNLEITRNNIFRANLNRAKGLKQIDFLATRPPFKEPGIIVTNPPYGERLDGIDIKKFYAEIGDTLKQEYVGWTAWIIVPANENISAFGLKPSEKISMYNGAIECRLLKFEIFVDEVPND